MHKIKIIPTPIDPESMNLELLPEESDQVKFKSTGSPLHKLAIDVIRQLQSTIPDIKELKFLQPSEVVETFGLKSDPDQDVEIKALFFDNPEVLTYWDMHESCMGLHAVSSGIFETVDEDIISPEFRVLINLSEEVLKKHILEERVNELDPHSNRYDGESLFSYLVTITHELAHAVEFIQCSHGLPPKEAETQFECDETELTLQDLSSGHGVFFDFDENLTDAELEDICEERVEQKGIDWLNQINLNPELFNEVVDSVSPTNEEVDFYIQNASKMNTPSRPKPR